MSQIIRLKIDVTKILKDALFKGAKGTYLDASLILDDEPDQYGNHGMIVQDLGKERRDSGEKGPILGNAKYAQQRQKAPPQQQERHRSTYQGGIPVDDGDVPF
jgi:hypothetical protein